MNQLKLRACEAIDGRREELIAFGEDIWAHPELGYKEFRTAQKVAQALKAMGVEDMERCGITGIKAWLKRGEGPCVAVMGELDAVISPQHPFADPETGAAHACGHHAQVTALVGTALGLIPVLEHLAGSICLIAVPAEEFVELGWRLRLRQEGKISYLGGKQQLICEGAFDDVDMAIMMHSESNAPCPRVVVDGPSIGFIGKEVHFIGREAHAGGAPWKGINALNAANLAMMGIHANRETFRDEDQVRVHPILTKGGDLVNTVPADVRMESYVRAANVPAMQEANEKVNRAIRGGAYMVGAEVEILDIPGYLPMAQNRKMSRLLECNTRSIAPELAVEHGLNFGGSTDIGDLSAIMPVIQPTITGFAGAAHSKDYRVTDPYQAYILPAKLQAATVIDLLAENAAQALAIRAESPRKSKEEYMDLWKRILDGGDGQKL